MKRLFHILKNLSRNGETRCACCNAFCQGIKDPTGRILCYDCYKKIWG